MPDEVELVDVTKGNIKVIQTLVSRIFPISYTGAFYHEIVHNGKKDFNKLLRANGTDVGVVLCKCSVMNDCAPEVVKFWKEEDAQNLPEFVKTRDYEDINVKGKVKPSMLGQKVREKSVNGSIPESKENSDIQKYYYLYISSLGIVIPRRGEGLGEVLMEHVFKLAYTTPNLLCVVLHVQTDNEDALRFYKRHGFKVAKRIERYYTRLEPSSAFLLVWVPNF